MAALSITKQGTASNGRPVVYWSDGSWSYADSYGSQAIDPSGIGPSYNPIVHYSGTPDDPQPGSDGKSYTLSPSGQKSYQNPSLYGAPIPQGKNNFFTSGLQWNPQTGQYEQKGMDPGNLLSLGIGGLLGAEAIPAILGSATGAAAPATTAAAGPAGGVGIESAAAGLPASAVSALPGAVTAPALSDLAGLGAGYGVVADAGAGLGGAAGAIPSSIPLSDVNAVTLPGQAAAASSIPWSKLIAPLLGTGTGIVNAVLGSNAAKTAAQQEIAGAQQAIGTLTGLYQDAQKRYAPYQASGQAALGSLNNLLGLKVQ